MTDTAVRTKVHQTFDIHRDFATKITFNLEIRNSGSEFCNFRLSEIFYLGLRCNTGSSADLFCARVTNTEN